jgi:hypothetical protein
MKLGTKKQQGIYTLLAAVAVLAIIALLNSFNNQSQLKETELAAKKAEANKLAAIKDDAINKLNLTQKYQKYCLKGVQRIDSAGGYDKIVYGTAQKTITYYDTDAMRVYCTSGQALPSEACTAIAALSFETAYVCSGTNVASMLSGGNGVQVKTQIAGNAVVIDTVLLDAPGYVVIHKKTGSKPGAILATSQLLSTGAYQIVSIAMPEALKTWETYVAMLHKDNGDGNFNATDDAPIMDEKGDSAIMVDFSAVKGE